MIYLKIVRFKVINYSVIVTISRSFFKQVILRDIPSIYRVPDKDQTSSELDRLFDAVPRTAPNPNDKDTEVRILYEKLYHELRVIT